jgi:hypothetical protein
MMLNLGSLGKRAFLLEIIICFISEMEILETYAEQTGRTKTDK